MKTGRLNAADQKIAEQTLAEVAVLLRTRPDMTYGKMKALLDVSTDRIYRVAKSIGIRRTGGRRKRQAV
jgi:hypothetical protein